MRRLAILTCLVISAGCTHFSGPGKLRSNGGEFHGPGEFNQEEHGDEGTLPQAAYIPPRGPASRAYLPRAAFNLNWPLNYVKINQQFNPKKKRRAHLGVDFAGTKGTAIFSSHEGLVIYAGRAFRGFGKMVIVEYDDQWATLYAHLDKIQVKQGQIVEQGQTLGKMGRTGRATGVHLHFELLRNQRPIDPIPLLNEVQRLVDTKPDDKRAPTSL